jgi:hypothetical protein
MYNITIINRDADKIEIEGAEDYRLVSNGILIVEFSDGSTSIYAAGAWLEADIEPVDNWPMIRYYWQFANGSYGEIQPRVLAMMILGIDGPRVKTAHVWDRSLGGYVFYEK